MTVIPVINMDVAQVWRRMNDKLEEPKTQRKIILVIVCVALLLDNMLYMVIVPIIPNYLRDIGTWKTHKEPGAMIWDNSTAVMENSTAFMENSTAVWNKSAARHLRNSTTFWKKGQEKTVYEGEAAAIGILFASKAFVQLLVNPFSGHIIDKIGYDIPMMIGLTIMFFSTAMFAYGEGYNTLFFARALQGVGSAFADTGGLAMIADRFTEEEERSKAIGIAQAFISFGSLVAPPFGGFLCEFAGKEVPFIVLSLVSLLDGFVLLFVMRPVKIAMKEQGIQRPKATPIYKLLMDKYIAIAAGTLVMANVSLAFLEPTISIWMKNTIEGIEEWQMGLVWLPAFFPHVFGVYITVKMCKKYPRYQWLVAAVGLAMEGISSIFVPFSTNFWFLIFPLSGICFGIAQVDTSLLPMLGYLVDMRYVSVYGSIYAIADISYSLAYAIGPVIAGEIVMKIGFTGLNMLIAVSNLAYVPALLMLRNIYDYKQFENENAIVLEEMPSAQYQTFTVENGNANKIAEDAGIGQPPPRPPPPQEQPKQSHHDTNPFRQASCMEPQASTPQISAVVLNIDSSQQKNISAQRKPRRLRGYRTSDMERIINSSDEEQE